MQGPHSNTETREKISGFDRRIDEMHLAFMSFRNGELQRMPEWERLERELIVFSRKRIPDTHLSVDLERVMFKFQNRKKIWLRWIQEIG
jgi:hypothetical protein